MKTYQFGLWTLACCLVLAAQTSAQAQHDPTPEEIARRCIHSVTHLSERCVRANAETAHECIRRIEALLERGHVEEAVHLARRCVREIEERSDHCVEEIHHRCRRCVNALLDLGEEELARRVARACHRAVGRVRHSEQRAVNAIRSLFGEGDG